ncbi:unnamed protein product [Trichogramma brassicae]|uniref:Uncharacterized protein n=1 Tax=Trichogramma brassicae TaxID=86971 RepID=A0A6H5HXD5_9HYME|nr:unnamed protein product [Trichogramma brassicae]
MEAMPGEGALPSKSARLFFLFTWALESATEIYFFQASTQPPMYSLMRKFSAHPHQTLIEERLGEEGPGHRRGMLYTPVPPGHRVRAIKDQQPARPSNAQSLKVGILFARISRHRGALSVMMAGPAGSFLALRRDGSEHHGCPYGFMCRSYDQVSVDDVVRGASIMVDSEIAASAVSCCERAAASARHGRQNEGRRRSERSPQCFGLCGAAIKTSKALCWTQTVDEVKRGVSPLHAPDILCVVSACLRTGIFPRRWKKTEACLRQARQAPRRTIVVQAPLRLDTAWQILETESSATASKHHREP